MPVKPRGRSWQASLRHDGQQYRKSFKTEAEARAWESAALARIARGEPPFEPDAPGAGGGWTMRSLMNAVVDRHWKGTANEDKACSNAEEVVEILGPELHPSSVGPLQIDDLVAELRKRGNGDATVNRKLAALSKMLGFAVTRGVIKAKPKIDRQREKQGRLRWLTPAEERRVLDYCDSKGDDEYRDLVVFLVDVGCRIGEACRVRWADIDDVYVRFFRTKNGRNRAVPQTPRVRETLKRLHEKRPDSEGPFVRWTPNTASKRWKEYREAAGIKDTDAVLHCLRHTCASRLVQAGTPIQVVQQWLGHETLQITLRYAHLAPCNLLAAVEVLHKVAQQVEVKQCRERQAASG